MSSANSSSQSEGALFDLSNEVDNALTSTNRLPLTVVRGQGRQRGIVEVSGAA